MKLAKMYHIKSLDKVEKYDSIYFDVASLNVKYVNKTIIILYIKILVTSSFILF